MTLRVNYVVDKPQKRFEPHNELKDTLEKRAHKVITTKNI
jgi:hypothetical protein